MRYWPFILVLGIVFIGCAMMHESDDSDAATVVGSGTQADPWTRWEGTAWEFWDAVDLLHNSGETYYTLIGAYFNVTNDDPREDEDSGTGMDYYFNSATPSTHGLSIVNNSLVGTTTSTGTVTIFISAHNFDLDETDDGWISLVILPPSSGTCGDNLTWELIGNGELVISGYGAMYDYTSGTAPWYEYRSAITSLSLPVGLTSIGAYAFQLCSSITGTLVIPDGVTSVGDYAFFGCSGFTGTLTLPSGITAINYASFQSCRGLTSLVLPDGLLSIGASSFRDCENLAGTLTLPSSISSIGTYAFRGCHNLTGTLTIPTSVTTLGNNAFDGCWGLITLKIMSRPNIGNYAFRQCFNVTGIEFYANQAPLSIGIDAFRLGDSSHSATATVRSVGNWAASSLSGDYTTFIFISWYAIDLTANGDGTVSGGGMYDEGASVTIIATPAAHNHFVVWSDGNTSNPRSFTVTGNISLTAYFTINTYTIAWDNWDGTRLETDTNVPYGTTPTYDGATPTRPATAQYTYTFTGWSPAISTVTGNQTYTAQYTEIALHTVIWKNWDGTVLDTEKVPEGTTPIYNGATPTRAMSVQYIYTFAGWTPTIVPITKDSTYTAQFSYSYREYTDGNWTYNILDTGNAVLIGYSGIGGIVQIPNTLNGTDVSTIGDALKNDSSITGVIIPSGIAAINEGAFSGTSITDVLNLSELNITGTSYGLDGATIHTSIPGWFYISDVEYTDSVPDNSTVSKLIRIIPLLILIGVIVMIARNRVEDE